MTELYTLFRLCIGYAPPFRGDGFGWVAALDLAEWSEADLEALDELGYVRDPGAWATEFARQGEELWEIVAPPVRAVSHLPASVSLPRQAVDAWIANGPPPGLVARTTDDDQGRPVELLYRQPGPPDGPIVLRETRQYLDDGSRVDTFEMYRDDDIPWSQWQARRAGP